MNPSYACLFVDYLEWLCSKPTPAPLPTVLHITTLPASLVLPPAPVQNLGISSSSLLISSLFSKVTDNIQSLFSGTFLPAAMWSHNQRYLPLSAFHRDHHMTPWIARPLALYTVKVESVAHLKTFLTTIHGPKLSFEMRWFQVHLLQHRQGHSVFSMWLSTSVRPNKHLATGLPRTCSLSAMATWTS